MLSDNNPLDFHLIIVSVPVNLFQSIKKRLKF